MAVADVWVLCDVHRLMKRQNQKMTHYDSRQNDNLMAELTCRIWPLLLWFRWLRHGFRRNGDLFGIVEKVLAFDQFGRYFLSDSVGYCLIASCFFFGWFRTELVLHVLESVEECRPFRHKGVENVHAFWTSSSPEKLRIYLQIEADC